MNAGVPATTQTSAEVAGRDADAQSSVETGAGLLATLIPLLAGSMNGVVGSNSDRQGTTRSQNPDSSEITLPQASENTGNAILAVGMVAHAPSQGGTPALQAGDAAPAPTLRSPPFKDGSNPSISANHTGRIFDTKPQDTEKLALTPVLAKSSTDVPAASQPDTVTSFPALLLHAQGVRPSDTPHIPSLKTGASLGTPAWNQEVGDRVVWMVRQQESRAELVLTPPQFGRVEISLSINGDQASASFVAANAAVRDALEAALPRLRESLAGAGIHLGQAHVGTGLSQESASNGSQSGDNPGFVRHNSGHDVVSVPAGSISGISRWQMAGRGLIDTFA
ncbi:MAG TPA: flagellar hook-length control protein FliK [Rhodocyclaceae bacterium]|nr:flagellar hook-length control protein FliK [Rhodocyclaceae bacterium]